IAVARRLWASDGGEKAVALLVQDRMTGRGAAPDPQAAAIPAPREERPREERPREERPREERPREERPREERPREERSAREERPREERSRSRDDEGGRRGARGRRGRTREESR